MQMVHRFLRFDPSNPKERGCLEKFEELNARRDMIATPRRLCWDTLAEVNQEERLREWLEQPLENLLSINEPVFMEITIEFFSTLTYRRPRKHLERNFQANGIHGLQFRLG